MMLWNKPQWFWAGICGVALGVILLVNSNMWTITNQFLILVSVGALWVASSETGELQRIMVWDADIVAMTEMRRRQRRGDEGIPRGPLKIIPQMKVNDEGGALTGRTVAIQSLAEDKKVFLIDVPMTKDKYGKADITSVTAVDSWTIYDKPNYMVMKPDELSEYIRIMKKAESKTMEGAGVK